VQRLLRSDETVFVLVSGPGRQRVADTLFFARRLVDAGYRLGPVVMNRVHPQFGTAPPQGWTAGEAAGVGRELLGWLGERDRRGADELRSLLGERQTFIELPLLPEEPTDLGSLAAMGRQVSARLDAAAEAGR
jgi:hypothetical protein